MEHIIMLLTKYLKIILFLELVSKTIEMKLQIQNIKMKNIKKQMQDGLLIHIRYILNFYLKLDYLDT